MIVKTDGSFEALKQTFTHCISLHLALSHFLTVRKEKPLLVVILFRLVCDNYLKQCNIGCILQLVGGVREVEC